MMYGTETKYETFCGVQDLLLSSDDCEICAVILEGINMAMGQVKHTRNIQISAHVGYGVTVSQLESKIELFTIQGMSDSRYEEVMVSR